jgi:hypothetical protein
VRNLHLRRDVIRSPLCALLSGLILAACGLAPEESGLAPSGDTLGTQRSALCSGTSVSTLNISGISSWGGEMAGNGNWAVSGGANAVRLEYWVDGTLRTSEERPGTSGTWYFSTLGITCGAHTFEVKAIPMVMDSAGTDTTCWSSPGLSASQAVTQDCPTASLSCSRSSSSFITCTGSGSGGSGSPYSALWQEEVQFDDGSEYISTWDQGAFTQPFFCQYTTFRTPSDRLTVRFKVRDSSGMASPIRSISYFCAP